MSTGLGHVRERWGIFVSNKGGAVEGTKVGFVAHSATALLPCTTLFTADLDDAENGWEMIIN